MRIIMVSVLCLQVSGCDGKPSISTTSGYGHERGQPQIIGDDSFRADTMRALSKLRPSEYAYLDGIHKGHEPTCRSLTVSRGYRVDGYYDGGTGQAGICRSGRSSVERMAEIIKHENDCHARFEREGDGLNSDHTEDC